MLAIKDYIDRVLNWSGGSYVGLATLVVLGMGVAEFISGTPMVVVMPDKTAQIYITHAAPQWLVGLAGIYVAILGLFWIGKPINTYVDAKAGKPPTEPVITPVERPLEK